MGISEKVVVTYWEMLPVISSMKFWMTDLQRHIWTWDFPNWNRLCQSMDGEYRCFDRTDSKVISDIVLYELQKFLIPFVYLCHFCIGVTKLWNSTVRVIMPIPPPLSLSLSLSPCPSAMNNITRNICGFFENLTWKLIFHLSLITIASAVHQPTLHWTYHLAEYYL
jgi:hypothetical protein